MNLLTLLLDGLVEFVRRNPVTCLIILILALFFPVFPALIKGFTIFVLYFVLGCVVLFVILGLLIYWRFRKLRRQMEEHFEQSGAQNPFDGGARAAERREGEVKIYKTSAAPEKKVSKDVGDYVEFEEEKDR